MEKNEQSLEINGSPQKCFETICDYETYPQWQSSIKDVQILERENGKATIVEYSLDALLKTITYSLRYEYKDDDPKNIVLEWFYVGGDLKNVEGRYTFKEMGENKTYATLYMGVDIGIWAPKMVLNTFRNKTMKDSIFALKKRVEGT